VHTACDAEQTSCLTRQFSRVNSGEKKAQMRGKAGTLGDFLRPLGKQKRGFSAELRTPGAQHLMRKKKRMPN
jgi:hypothetical protein